jgi:hypothetical protein
VNEIELAHSRTVPRLPSGVSRFWARPPAAAFALAFAGSLIVAFLLQGPKPFFGDSGNYWALAETFTHGGHFSFANFESPVRGYVLPLMIYVLRTLGEGVGWTQSSLAKLFNVALFALIGGVLAPRLAEIIWPGQHWGVLRRVGLTALLIVFWSGDLSYPLSDFPGLALGLITLVLIARTDTPASMLIAGLTAGMAVDVRPAYLPFVPMLLVIVGRNWYEQRGAAHASSFRRALCLGLLIVGFLAASLPQSLASHRHYGTLSFIPGGPAHLTEEQLTSSILLRRYDTYMEPSVNAFPMYYFDHTGLKLLLKRPGRVVTGTGQYIEVALEHPGFMAGLTAQHIINGLDMRYSTAYVEHIDSGGKLWLRLSGFLLVFLALVRLLWPAARRGLGRARWRYAIALLLCSASSAFTAIETRYMLPVWLAIYLLVLAPGWPNPIATHETGRWRRYRTPAILLVSYLAFMAAVWQIVSLATAYVA